jgi:3-isopropylmalate/(R)-2-methylmalate dehydratase small subunit
MSIDKFQTITSPAVPLPIENVDTDQIIPARFLKATTREGFGENLSGTGGLIKTIRSNPILS